MRADILRAHQYLTPFTGLFIFLAVLAVTGIKMLIAANSEPDIEGNIVVRVFKKMFRVTSDFEGNSFIVRREGKLYATPLLMVLVVIELAGLVFALDSITIFAVSQDPFIVYTSNVFAILGLRALYLRLRALFTDSGILNTACR